ncbi:serine dehydratase subunit alpha family protein [Xylanibacter muris]|uniref:UPF0597 protein HPS56_07390 n=1 Tax=Xylanibacter muris TaxID=2736290 RepID=A0ABX2AN38_9BACT|nr:L-serine ammonia-lyase, iron-sulfur-dependent, subunit alpha [Xylanibacter muris]NPD92175.1 serine dehydratase subunit alpha family protein [Xylanibacter muris]
MLEQHIRDRIIALIDKEVMPAIGCTEPMAVALCVAKGRETLGCMPDEINVRLSANILKNAMGVGIPGTGMIGLPIAVALGAVAGKSEYGLEVIRDLCPEALAGGKEYVAGNHINISLKNDITEKLYIEVECLAGADVSHTVISGSHTNFVYVASNGNVILDRRNGVSGEGCDASDEDIRLDMRMVYEFAAETPLDEISFILKTRDYNMRAAREALLGNYGHNLGKTIDRPLAKGIFGNSIFSHIIARTASACDARMGGAMIPVMSNSGSGNQGICATIPVAVYAAENENTEEELVRALMLSHLTAIYIKQSLGKLSALCGCVVASIGSSCGITYLMGGDYARMCRSVKNMIANLTGMICDGAKPSCSLKISSGVSTAILSALLAMEGKCVSSAEGIIDDDVDKSIHNLTSIGADAMRATDDMVLSIMTHKGGCR